MPPPASPKPQNVIWIFGDQHRNQAMGLHGDPNVSTPHLDNLARQGVDFPRALMGTPLCCPCRGSLLTNRYPHECVPGHELPLPDGYPTIADAFGRNGCHTAWFGKWHLDGYKEANGRGAFHIVPRERRGGFGTWVGYENNNSQYDCWVHGHDEDEGEVLHQRLPGYETDSLTDLFIAYLRRQGAGQPFFAALSVQPPHNPYVAPGEDAARHRPTKVILRPNVPPIRSVETRARNGLAGYYAMIENLDANVGRVRQALRECGLEENTLIMFFSDHGDLHGSHVQFLKTSPLEESIRVPFIIGGGSPFYTQHAGANPALVNHVDVAPTTLGLCGLDAPVSAFLQSVIPTGHPDSVDRPWRGVVTHDHWKLVCLEGQPWLMFDLNEDPYELRNLAFNTAYREKRRELGVKLREWIERTGDRLICRNFRAILRRGLTQKRPTQNERQRPKPR